MRSDTLRRHTIAKHKDFANCFHFEEHPVQARDDFNLKDKLILDVIPSNQKRNAQKLLQYLRKHGSNVISWNPNGDVSIYGSNLQGTNIVDLIDDVFQTSRHSKHVNTSRKLFLSALGDVNVPETLIRNEMALKTYRAIKNKCNLKIDE